MAWTFSKNADGEIEAHDGTRVRAKITRHPKSALPWRVYRVYANGQLGGNNDFRTLTAAKSFCGSNAGIWGSHQISDAEVDAYIKRLAAADLAAGIE